MLSKIITKLNLRIVNFLINNQANLSEIARKTNITKANTFKALKEISSLDIVRKTIIGKSHLYRFNFLHPKAKDILNIIEEKQKASYNEKLNNLPILTHSFLQNSLKQNYQGCIFFGSSINANYKDIDIFILLKSKRNTKEIGNKLKLIEKKVSPLFGSKEELETGIKNQDMLYKNIANGIYFGDLNIINIKCKELFLRKKDIVERFIMGYGDVLSCLEFPEKDYIKVHLEKGVMDLIYSILNYYDFFPKNDKEAINLFKSKLNETKPKSVKFAIKIIQKYAWIL